MLLRLILFVLISTSAFAKVDLSILSKETQKRFEKVPEFAFIQEEANKLGVKVYLFGGTASAFAHYVRWDLEREAGDDKYQKERFDYDFTNIYRGNQDLDIVVDGTAEKAAQLERTLKEKYPHFVGNKTAWEVRLLQAQIGDKLPLLGDFDFLNQHTDTNSTGMLTINPDEGGVVFRDLFSWEDPESQFLKDVAAGEIKFLFSKTHGKTSRFKGGKNPPIFAAVRYLAKLAQYEVVGTFEDLVLIKKIIKETNWEEVKNNAYVKHKLEEFGKKVLLNAPDSEYAWNLLEDVGLREELMKMDGGQLQKQDSLSWWMNKEPLRSKEIGQGSGKTASEIFKGSLDENNEIVISHETNSFLAYENITRSSKGRANAFISRANVSGEAAVFGDGFYTALGMKGARGTNLTIRFKLDPEAKEGTDFSYDGGFIVIKNKNAVMLIQENLSIELADLLKLLAAGDINATDKGLIEKFKRKFERKQFNEKEINEAYEFVESWFNLRIDLPENVKYDLSKIKEWKPEEYIDNFLEEKKHYLESLQFSITSNIDYWIENPKSLKALAEWGHIDRSLAQFALVLEEWTKHAEIVEILIKRGDVDPAIATYLLSREHWLKHPKANEWIQIMIDRGNADGELIRSVLPKIENWEESSLALKWIKIFLKRDHFGRLLKDVFPDSDWLKTPEGVKLVEKSVKNRRHHHSIAMHLLSQEYWVNHPDSNEWLNLIREGGVVKYDVRILHDIVFSELWAGKAAAVKWINSIVNDAKDPKDEHISIVLKVLRERAWAVQPIAVEWFSKIIKTQASKSYRLREAVEKALSLEIWQSNKNLRAYMGTENISVTGLRKKMGQKPFLSWLKSYRKENGFMCREVLF